MKKNLRAILFLAFIFGTLNLFSQATGYVNCPDPGLQAQFDRGKRTSTNHYITLGGSGASLIRSDIIYWDANFNVIWNQSVARTTVQYWVDVIETTDGNFVALGANFNNGGSCVAFKLSPSGTVLWQKEYYNVGNFVTAFSLSKSVGNDAGFIFGGISCGTAAYLVRCDANGIILWQHEYFLSNATNNQSIHSISPENDAYILTGKIMSPTSQVETTISKVDSAGNWIWSKIISEPLYNEIPVRTIKLSTGNYATICRYDGSPNNAELILYFDTTGTVTSIIKFTDAGATQLEFLDIAEVSNGKTIIVGAVYASQQKSIYLESDPSGNILWQKNSVGVLPGFVASKIYAVAQTATNNFACFGMAYEDMRTIAIIDSTGAGWCNATAATMLSGTPDPYTVDPTTAAVNPTFIRDSTVNYSISTLTLTTSVLCGTVGIENLPVENEALTIFPNPAFDVITLNFGDAAITKADVSFYNLLGEMVLSVKNSSAALNIEMLPSGVYLMEVVLDGERVVKRVVKE